MSLVFALLLAAAVPLAEDPGFAEGVRLYSQFEFEQATFRFESAAVEQDRVPAERARVFLWLGLSYAAIGKFDDAGRAFTSGLRLDPAATLETEVSPKVQELFAAAQQDLADEAARAAATPAPAPVAPAPAATELPWLLVGGGVGAAVGVVALAGAGVLGVLAAQNAAIAADPDQFQDDAQRAQDTGNAQIAGAVAVGVVGAVLVVGGGALVAIDLIGE